MFIQCLRRTGNFTKDDKIPRVCAILAIHAQKSIENNYDIASETGLVPSESSCFQHARYCILSADQRDYEEQNLSNYEQNVTPTFGISMPQDIIFRSALGRKMKES